MPTLFTDPNALITKLTQKLNANNYLPSNNSAVDAARQRLQSTQSNLFTQNAMLQQRQEQRQMLAKLQRTLAGLPQGYAASNSSPDNLVYHKYTGPPNVDAWVNQALGILGLSKKYVPGVEHMIQMESGGNPNAVNNWDINAKQGHPSQGLMQTIPSTFSAYALPGYNKNILDPVSNIIAGIRYALKNYGSGMLMAGGRRDSHGNYIGY